MITLGVRHNIEVAHRLFSTQGKCEAIHGHSMDIQIGFEPGSLDNNTGMALDYEGKPLEFGAMKKAIRGHLDTTYDHRLLLNENDPWAQSLYTFNLEETDGGPETARVHRGNLPGLNALPGDPTTENIAKWIATWAAGAFYLDTRVCVWETAVNFATYTAGADLHP